MKDGLYKVRFATPLDEGAGVVHLQGGQIRGGDSGLYYVGTYLDTGGKFTAQVKADVHTKAPGVQSVFGIDRVTISLEGTSSEDKAEMKGTAKEAPGVSFKATLTRIAD
jgi:hypothetical protein